MHSVGREGVSKQEFPDPLQLAWGWDQESLSPSPTALVCGETLGRAEAILILLVSHPVVDSDAWLSWAVLGTRHGSDLALALPTPSSWGR